MDNLPNKALYINNINEKVQIDVLKKMFYMVFSQYGRVTEIIAHKGLKMRGQAWVVFQDVASATNAMRGKQGFNFYGKPLRIQYAKDKSPGASSSSESGATLKRKREDGGMDEEETDAVSKAAKVVSNDVPSRLLLAQNLPEGVDNATLQVVFQQCVGFADLRFPVPGNPSIAFVEFGDEVQAGMALRQLSGFQLTATHLLELTFGK